MIDRKISGTTLTYGHALTSEVKIGNCIWSLKLSCLLLEVSAQKSNSYPTIMLELCGSSSKLGHPHRCAAFISCDYVTMKTTGAEA
jgi:hypothetical protein